MTGQITTLYREVLLGIFRLKLFPSTTTSPRRRFEAGRSHHMLSIDTPPKPLAPPRLSSTHRKAEGQKFMMIMMRDDVAIDDVDTR
ncbi:hypothetical protein FOPE_01467 [Fonsecaea pedrosoi]|nr:hypothetical protein FOPE_01467 [Fonsecaea pedrosoi]